jgi:predicted metal-dependent peptidase
MDTSKYISMPFEYKIARFSLLLRKAYPFLGELCMRVQKHRKEMSAPAATDGYNIYLNEEILGKLHQESLNFVLLHELFHIILKHAYPKDMPFYERRYLNIACDLVVNRLIMNMEYELRINGLPIQPIASTYLSADDLSKDPSSTIADTFIEQAKQQCILSETPPLFVEIAWKSFKAIVPNDADFIFDILWVDDVSNLPTDADIQELLAECFIAAGNDGLPRLLKDLMKDISNSSKLPWHIILKRYLEASVEIDDYSFCPPDKRLLYSEIIMPGESEEDKALSNSLVVLDVSSSVDKEQLLAQLAQVRTVLSELDFEGFIIAFASDVHQEAPLTNEKSLRDFVDNLQTGGGTDWGDVVSYVKENKRSYRPTIVFTDGYFFSFDKGLSDVIFITQDTPPYELSTLGKVIQVNK